MATDRFRLKQGQGATAAGGVLRGRHLRGGRWLVAVIVAAGVASAVLLHQRAHSASPVLTAPNAQPPAAAPRTASQAAGALLAFRPLIAEGATMSDAVGAPLGAAMREATGQPPGGRFPGKVTVEPAAGGYRVTIALPVNVSRLRRLGEIYGGPWPGASHERQGMLSVETPDGHLYAIHMDAATHVARFRFLLAANAATVTALNWNATALLRQTDASDPLA